MSAVAHYVGEFARRRDTLPGAGNAWVDALRGDAIRAFEADGFPSSRAEDWRYTRLGALERKGFRLAEPGAAVDPDALDPLCLPLEAAWRAVFVDGRLAPALSHLPSGGDLRVTPLADALADGDASLGTRLTPGERRPPSAFTRLNTAFMGDGAVVRVEPGHTVERPLHLLFVTASADAGAASHPRLVVEVGAGASLTVLESYAGVGAGGYLTNALTRIVLADGAALEHVKLQSETDDAYHIASVDVRQSASSRYVHRVFQLGARLGRTEYDVALEGEGAQCTLDGLFLVAGRQHSDLRLRIEHESPECRSEQLFKGILDGHSRGVFDGRVRVHPDAQKSDARQTNHNLLLSRDAEVDTKPQLEIYADDVKCSHGATVGQLDDNMLFYLRARGIDGDTARALLTYGFARDVVDRITDDAVRNWVADALFARLPDAKHLRSLVE
ncbi:MAG: Fe-S cluster assembly protein SufD [Ectothiorhodospiraceae bacterium]|nr:Fe-S cluster assembly protein SufD [Chromatiales bacterium]MCP5156851.1 Fe-S cluster assembly protein SufD [Ectothiorhodospiraceae bacterium]